MTDLDVRDFFAATAAEPPAPAFDLDRAVADGHGLRRRSRRRRTGLVAGAVLVAGTAVAAAAVIGRSPYVRVLEPSEAMTPTIAVGDSVVLDKRLAAQRLDVIQITIPGTDTQALLRVVGLPGDTVSCPDQGNGSCAAVEVNGTPFSEAVPGRLAGKPFEPVTVAAGQVFVLGDNRDVALDSTAVGPFTLTTATGVAVAVSTPGQGDRAVAGAPAHEMDGNQIDPAGSLPPASAVPGS